MVILAITWGTLAAAGFAGLGLGIGIVVGVSILRWVRTESGPAGGGRVSGRRKRSPIDDEDSPA